MTSPQLGRESTQPTLPYFVHFKCTRNVGPLPVRQIVQFHGRRMPTALARVTVRRTDAVDKNALESICLHGGRRPVRPVSKSGIRFATPRHGRRKAQPGWTRESHHPLRPQKDRYAMWCGYVANDSRPMLPDRYVQTIAVSSANRHRRW
jgi:hypothetical protein